MVRIPDELQDVLSVAPEIMSGAVCFRGRRILVQSLLDTLYHDGSIDDFLEGFPDVTREEAMAVVQWEQMQARRAFDIPVLVLLDHCLDWRVARLIEGHEVVTARRMG